MQVDREELIGATRKVGRFKKARSPKPVLEHLLLAAANGGATLSANSLECGAETNVECVSSGIESLLLPPRLVAALKDFTGATVELAAVRGGVRYACGAATGTVAAMSPDEWPGLATVDGTEHQMPAHLIDALKRVAVASDKTGAARYALGGVYMGSHEGNAVAVATDGRHLVWEYVRDAYAGRDIVIPYHFVMSLGFDGDFVDVCENGSAVQFSDGDNRYVTSLVDGRFPKWESVVPQSEPVARATATVGELLSCIRQARIACDKESTGITFHFADSATLRVSAQTGEVGEANVSSCATCVGESLDVVLSWPLVTPYLSGMELDATLQLEAHGAGKAVVFRCDNIDGGMVVMPLFRN